jgi:hypothetical protein
VPHDASGSRRAPCGGNFSGHAIIFCSFAGCAREGDYREAFIQVCQFARLLSYDFYSHIILLLFFFLASTYVPHKSVRDIALAVRAVPSSPQAFGLQLKGK